MAQKITPYLWFDNQADEAAHFYVSIFPNSKLLSTSPGPDGKVMIASFELNGQHFLALNGGPGFQFTEAVSFLIECGDQEEVDYYWERLTANGGEPGRCGWLKDQYSLSWQVIPRALAELISDPNPVTAGNVMQAMLQMSKIDIAQLRAAHERE